MIYLVFVLIAAAAALYLWYNDGRTVRDEQSADDSRALLMERQAAIKLSLSDIEYELSVGKMEQNDFDRLQSELLSEWEMLDAKLSALPMAEPQAEKAGKCSQCGVMLVAGSRFCHACGAKVLQILIALLLLPLGHLDALDIRVRLQNGTTGKIHSQPLKVQLLKLEKGMQVVTAATTVNGKAEFQNLPESSAGPYMVQTDYQSVTYSKVVPPNMPSPADVALDIYESTASTARLRVRTLVELRRIAEDRIAGIMILFFINQDNRTFTGDKGIEFYLPEQSVVEQASVSVGSGASNIQWLKVSAEKSGAPGAYRIAQSVKPGERIAQIMFNLPYDARGTELAFRQMYPQDAGLQLIAEPENLEVRQAGRLLSRTRDKNLGRGLISFPATEQRVALKLSGGSIVEMRADETEAELVVRSPLETWQKLVFPLLAVILFLGIFRLREYLRA